jgi:hypothetical protein
MGRLKSPLNHHDAVSLAVVSVLTLGAILWALTPAQTSPWSIIAPGNTVWDFLENARRRQSVRRPSWGGLTSQGAKASIKTNLRSDRNYLVSSVAAG